MVFRLRQLRERMVRVRELLDSLTSAKPAMAALKASDADRFETLAHTVREDNAWIDSGENDNAIVQTLSRTPGSLGVFG